MLMHVIDAVNLCSLNTLWVSRVSRMSRNCGTCSKLFKTHSTIWTKSGIGPRASAAEWLNGSNNGDAR